MKEKMMTMAGLLFSLILIVVPVIAEAQQQAGSPPVGAPIVREGDYAVNLVKALNLSTTQDEVEAEGANAEDHG